MDDNPKGNFPKSLFPQNMKNMNMWTSLGYPIIPFITCGSTSNLGVFWNIHFN